MNALVLRTPWRDLADEVLDVLCDLEAPASTDLLDSELAVRFGTTPELDAMVGTDADVTPAHVFADVLCWDAWDRWQYGVGAANEGYEEECEGCAWCGFADCGNDCD